MANTRGTVEIYEGNDTVRRLMSTALARAGFRVVERHAESPTPAHSTDFLVVDVDSGLPDAEERAASYRGASKPVLVCGVRPSRDRFTDFAWLDRPFSKSSFLAQCLILVDGLPSERLTLTGDDDPITRELQYEEAVALEKQLGLAPGVLGTDHLEDADDDVVELDAHGSAIIEVADLRSLMTGGKLVGAVAKREVDASELIQERAEIPRLQTLRTPTFNQTMPDSPHAIADVDAPPDTSSTTESGIVPPPDESQTSRMAADIKNVARMLADSWTRIGTTARTEDRADRIERVLASLLSGGMRAVTQELRRIPAGVGFAGSLEALPVIDLLRTVRDRRLRGRLEVSVNEGTWVLFLDGATLEDIENLSGSADLQILDALFRLNRLSPQLFSELSQGYATGEFHEPATMKLLGEQLVTKDDIERARVRCAKDAFRQICASRRGNFAFLEVEHGDGQSWPVRGLNQGVDTLLLEVLREAEIDTGDSQATARTVLQVDDARAASLGSDALTPEEAAVLRYFGDANRVGEVLEQLSQPEMTAVVNRLKKVELLRRTGPRQNPTSRESAVSRETPPPREVPLSRDASAPREPLAPGVAPSPPPAAVLAAATTAAPPPPPPIDEREPPTLPGAPPVSNQTVVNPIGDLVSRHERRRNASNADDQTTHLKNSTHIGPDFDDDDDDEDDLRTDIRKGD